MSDGTSSFMVDAGLEGEAPLLAEDLRDEGFAPESLSAIVLTHGHADHAGGAGYFKRQFGTRIVAGLGEQDMLRSGHNDRLCPTNGAAEGRREADQAETYQPVEADELVAGSLDLGPITGISARAVALPGHTRGSLVVVLPGAALVGDLFRGAVLGSTAETHFYMCDLADNRRDVSELVAVIAPNARVFFTGHFGPVSREAVVDSDLYGPLTRSSR